VKKAKVYYIAVSEILYIQNNCSLTLLPEEDTMLRGFIQEMPQRSFCIVRIPIHPLSSEMSYVTYWDNTDPFSRFPPRLCARSCSTRWNCSTCNAFIHFFLREDKPTGAVKIDYSSSFGFTPSLHNLPPTDKTHTHTQIEEDRCAYRHSHTTEVMSSLTASGVGWPAMLTFHCLGLHLILADQHFLCSQVKTIALKLRRIPRL